MPRKPPLEERRLILRRDERRKYGARLSFQVLMPSYFGNLENATLLLPDGTLALVEARLKSPSEVGARYELALSGYPTAAEAEEAGLRLSQTLLLLAISLNFGLRLDYRSHRPPTVFDRTVSLSMAMTAEGHAFYQQDMVLNEFFRALDVPLHDERLLLSMELFVASALESNDRARFIMAVSALEPLADQKPLGESVALTVDRLATDLSGDPTIDPELRQSLLGRLLQLKEESVRQALRRVCTQWFSDDPLVWRTVDEAYALRSQLLHQGRLSDLDVLLHEETARISNVLRRVYQHAFAFPLRAPVAA